MVSEDAVFKLVKMFRLRCLAGFEPEKDDDVYAAVAEDCQLARDDEALFEAFDTFLRQHQNDQYVRWDRFRAYLWEMKHARQASRSYAQRKRQPCAYCGETGYMTIAAPHSATGPGLAPEARDFHPPAPYGKADLYALAVPCVCPVGKRREARYGCPPEFRDLRNKWIKTYALRGYSPLMVTRCIIRSRELRYGTTPAVR